MEGYVLYGVIGFLVLVAAGGGIAWWLDRIGSADRRAAHLPPESSSPP